MLKFRTVSIFLAVIFALSLVVGPTAPASAQTDRR